MAIPALVESSLQFQTHHSYSVSYWPHPSPTPYLLNHPLFLRKLLVVLLFLLMNISLPALCNAIKYIKVNSPPASPSASWACSHLSWHSPTAQTPSSHTPASPATSSTNQLPIVLIPMPPTHNTLSPPFHSQSCSNTHNEPSQPSNSHTNSSLSMLTPSIA